MSVTAQSSKVQIFRLVAVLFAVFFFWMWWSVYQPVERLGSVPDESVVPTQYLHARSAFEKVEEIFRAAFLMCFAYAIEGIVVLGASIPRRFRDYRFERLFGREPRVFDASKSQPALITCDVDACLTPSEGGALSLRNFHKIRQYCAYSRRDKGYPPLIFVSARSQEYTELLCQTLDAINVDNDIPCVIEDGMALYYPAKKETMAIGSAQQTTTMENAREVLWQKLHDEYEFEPKRFMVSINITKQRSKYVGVSESAKAQANEMLKLRERVVSELTSASLKLDDYEISNSEESLDIVPAGVNRLSGLMKVLDERKIDLAKVVAMGNSDADEPILVAAHEAFCSLEAKPPIQRLISKVKEANFIKDYDSSAVVLMLEAVTGLKFN